MSIKDEIFYNQLNPEDASAYSVDDLRNRESIATLVETVVPCRSIEDDILETKNNQLNPEDAIVFCEKTMNMIEDMVKFDIIPLTEEELKMMNDGGIPGYLVPSDSARATMKDYPPVCKTIHIAKHKR